MSDGVDDRIQDLALLLVEKGPRSYVVDYLRGLMQSFDTSMGASLYGADPSLLRELLDEIDRRLAGPASPDRELLEAGQTKFREWLAARRI